MTVTSNHNHRIKERYHIRCKVGLYIEENCTNVRRNNSGESVGVLLLQADSLWKRVLSVAAMTVVFPRRKDYIEVLHTLVCHLTAKARSTILKSPGVWEGNMGGIFKGVEEPKE